METLRKEKMCWDEECENNAQFGTLYCERHYEMFLEQAGSDEVDARDIPR